MKKYYTILFAILFIISSCEMPVKEKTQTADFNIESVRSIIVENGKGWSKALTTKDISIIENLYDENAHYLPDGEEAIHGRSSIASYWKASMNFLNDIQLNMETLKGTKELLYETGKGIAVFPNEKGSTDTLPYKYVNVWKLNEDGEYRVVIDTYNDIQ